MRYESSPRGLSGSVSGEGYLTRLGYPSGCPGLSLCHQAVRESLLWGLSRFCEACYDEASYPRRTREEEPVATLYCPCGQAHELWGEFWWTQGRYQWIFFDYAQRSATYAEQVENCPACGRLLERKNLLSWLSDRA